MSQITNDAELRKALHELDRTRCHEVCALLVENVIEYNKDPRVARALRVAHDPDVTIEEMTAVYKSARAATVDSRTRCGADCDWQEQAAHFVARAAAAAVAPRGQCKASDQQWQVVMSCRMARNCALIDSDEVEDMSVNTENQDQYRIVREFLSL